MRAKESQPIRWNLQAATGNPVASRRVELSCANDARPDPFGRANIGLRLPHLKPTAVSQELDPLLEVLVVDLVR